MLGPFLCNVRLISCTTMITIHINLIMSLMKIIGRSIEERLFISFDLLAIIAILYNIDIFSIIY